MLVANFQLFLCDAIGFGGSWIFSYFFFKKKTFLYEHMLEPQPRWVQESMQLSHYS